VGVEKLFSGNFTSKIRSQVIECSFSADAEIDRNYCFGSFFNSHRRSHNFAPFVRQTGEGKAQTCAMAMFSPIALYGCEAEHLHRYRQRIEPA